MQTENMAAYARMRVNSFKGSEPSQWYYSGSFTINGENYLCAIRDFEISPGTALIDWYANTNTAGVNKITLTKSDGSAGPSFGLPPGDATNGAKTLDNLGPDTRYTLQLFSGSKSKGIMSFSTTKTVIYTVILLFILLYCPQDQIWQQQSTVLPMVM